MSPASRKGATVSVALCTRNGARFVGEQLRSILAQTRVPDEIVISDDASTDDTVAVARSVMEGFDGAAGNVSFVVLRNDVALGVAANFEQAIRACSGEFVALSDQDDVWHRDRIDRALAVFGDREDLLLVHANARLVDQDGGPLGPTLFDTVGVGDSVVSAIHSGTALSVLLKRNVVTGATTMIRRRLVDVAGAIPSPWIHDEWLGIVAAAFDGVDVIAAPIVDYRQHASNEIGAVQLTFAGKAKRMGEPGAERNARLLNRATVLAERFELLDLGPAITVAVAQKLTHERVRSSLKSNRLVRWPRVFRELLTGRYSRFGRGALDAVRDLIQPLDAPR